jgi:tripartite ATP-independent transporter DctM subunit
METGLGIIILLALLLFLLLIGFRVAFALGITGFLGLALLLPGSSYHMLANLSWSAINKFPLTPVPLFIFMGELLVFGKMNESLYGTLSAWLGNVRGGLCHATTASCAVFAAMSGSSLATSATLGTIAGPEMIKRGYSRSLTYGTIASGGTLGILIPPSITMIIYGNLAGVSIGHCFIAGVIPGIICAGMFIVLVDIWGRIFKDDMPDPEKSVLSFKAKLLGLVQLLPAAGLIFIVLGGIYLGVTTPTEAGAIGAFGAFILCLIQRNLSWRLLWKALLSTVRTTSFIMIIIGCASIVSFVVQFIRLPEMMTDFVTQMNLSRYLVIAIFYVIYIILGMLVDPVSMMVMTVPTILPTVVHLGFDPIWFSVMITLACEIGLITPPVGLNLYILQGISGCSLGEIAKGASPFVLTLILGLVLFTAFPGLCLYLVKLM